MTSFNELFLTYIEEADALQLTEVEVTRCDLNPETRVLTAECQSKKYLAADLCRRVQSAIQSGVQLQACALIFRFDPEALNEAACADLVREIRLKNAAVNGYFNGAEYALEDDTVNITLQFGGLERIKESGFAGQFAALVADRFHRTVTVQFDGQLEDMEL